MIESSSGSTVIDSYLGSSMLFFCHVAIFYQIVLLFFIKNRCFVLDSLCSQEQLVNNLIKTDREKMNEEILT